VPQRQTIALGCALLLGAAIAFPAGLFLGGSGGEQEGRSASRAGGEFRRVYSPSIYRDPYFLEQQRRNVDALEQSCRSTGQFCPEVRQVRQRLADREQGQ
jgi:hypothetical protein